VTGEEPESSGGICDLLTSTSVPSHQKVEGYKNSPIRQLATAEGRGPINYKHCAYSNNNSEYSKMAKIILTSFVLLAICVTLNGQWITVGSDLNSFEMLCNFLVNDAEI
jgi:hypothetical protein